ncbi:putative Ig domain-containing protein [Cellulomonas soli]
MRTTAPRSSSQASAAARPPVGLAHRLGRLAAAVAVATVAAVVVPVGAATPAQASVTQSIVPWAGSTDVMDPSGAMGFGQTFVPGTAMVLESASLTLSGVSEPRPELSVCPTDGVGLPVSCTAATSTSMSNGVVTGTFSGTPVILAAGTRYAVVVQVRDVSGLYSYYGSTALTYLTSDVYAAGGILFGYENQAGQRDILWGSAIDYGAPTADLPLSVTYSTPAAPAITSTTLPGGSLGQPYSQTLTATGSPAPSWGFSGPLPAGLTLSPGGVLSGTPTAVGSTTFTLIATNGVAPQATQSFTVTIAAVAPSAPASVTLAPADHAVTATWPASTSTGGAPPVTYEVGYQATGDAGWTPAGTTTATTAPINGLTPGTEYTVRVRATTTAGASAWTASSALVLPGTPTVSSTSAVATDSGAVVTWTGDDHGSAVSQADVAYRLVGDATWTSTTDTVTAADGSHTFTGLTNRATYEYSVTLRNAIGTSAPATGTVTPFLLAGSLTSDGTALASAPRLAGAPVTGHATGLPTGRSVDLVWAPGTADETVLDTGVADASGEATLTGSIPTGAAAGQHTVTIRPTGGTATVTSTVTITLPTTVSWAPTTARYGQSYSSTIVLGGESTTVTLVQGLPAGLTWNAAGAISGTPTQVGSFTVSVTADGVGGTRLYAATLTVEAVAPGVVTGMASTTGLSTPGRIDLELARAVDHRRARPVDLHRAVPTGRVERLGDPDHGRHDRHDLVAGGRRELRGRGDRDQQREPQRSAVDDADPRVGGLGRLGPHGHPRRRVGDTGVGHVHRRVAGREVRRHPHGRRHQHHPGRRPECPRHHTHRPDQRHELHGHRRRLHGVRGAELLVRDPRHRDVHARDRPRCSDHRYRHRRRGARHRDLAGPRRRRRIARDRFPGRPPGRRVRDLDVR